MNKLVKAGDIVFDVGSHIGVVACYLRTRATESGKIYAFEPFSKSYQRLCENIALNSYKNVYTNNVAISDEIGVAKFYYEPRDNQLNSLGKVSNGTNQLSESVDVNTETIDSYCEQNKINLINFLKIDTEGYEINVLKGAANMLTNKKIEIVQFEISNQPLESLGKTPDEIITYLNSKGYEVFEYIENTQTFQKIDKIIVGYDNFYSSHINLEKVN
jgi:FkbM family methyltransferase